MYIIILNKLYTIYSITQNKLMAIFWTPTFYLRGVGLVYLNKIFGVLTFVKSDTIYLNVLLNFCSVDFCCSTKTHKENKKGNT